MGLTKEKDISKTWGSHQPLLKSIIKILKPQSAVECGCGNYSTPFLQKVPSLLTIEHDSQWAGKIQKQFSPENKHTWFIKNFNTRNPTRIDELPAGEFEKINKYYKWVAEKIEPFDFLFNDTFTACRVPVILELGNMSKYILIHDLEPPGPEVYEWERLDEFFTGWNKYIHKPLGSIENKYQIPWTGLYSKKSIPLDKLNENMEKESIKLWDDFTPLEEIK